VKSSTKGAGLIRCMGVLLMLFLVISVPTAHASRHCNIDPASVYGDIARYYWQLGGPDGGLGCPTSRSEGDYPNDSFHDPMPRARLFEFGLILWVPYRDHAPFLMAVYQMYQNFPEIQVLWENHPSVHIDFVQIMWRINNGKWEQSNAGHEFNIVDESPNSSVEIKLQECEREEHAFWDSTHCFNWLPTVTLVTNPNTHSLPRPTLPVPPPTVPPSPPPTPPSISVTRKGIGVFHVIGDGFLTNHDVYLRIVDFYGRGINTVSGRQKIATTGANGKIDTDVIVLCIQSQHVYFSANYERDDSGKTIYSNIEDRVC
jgi:hypothetical protein